MKNSNHIYENIMVEVSLIIKKHLNEMARKPVNRTIDKKLWLTVSSIISRNRSSDAENIKPIGNDKNNLLQRYVAALIIMRKSCPESVNDIDKLKTFKLIGKKYLELGGTIQEILDLYNKNTNNSTSIAHAVDKSNVQTSKVTYTDNSDDEFDSWESLFKSNDSENADSFISDLELDSEETRNYNALKLISELPKDADIKQIFLKETGIVSLPGKFIEYNKKDSTKYTYLQYTCTKSSQYTPAKIAIELYTKQNWKIYTYSNALKQWWKGDKITEGDYFYRYKPTVEDTITKIRQGEYAWSLPIRTNKYTTANELFKLAIKNYCKSDDKKWESSCNILIYIDFIKSYHNFLQTIDNPVVKKMYEEYAFYDYILVSPDNGMIFAKRYNIDPKAKRLKYYELNYSLNYPIFPDDAFNNDTYKLYTATCYITYEEQYIIKFTGDVNYYDNIENSEKIKAEISVKHTELKNKRKLATRLKKCILDYAYLLGQGIDYLLSIINYLKIDKNGYPMLEKTGRVKMPNRTIWYGEHTNYADDIWRFKNRSKDKPYKGLSTKFPATYIYKSNDPVHTNAYPIPNSKLSGLVIDSNGVFVYTDYDLGNDIVTALLTLTDKGYKIFDQYK